jgi:dienelactone hydrolase
MRRVATSVLGTLMLVAAGMASAEIRSLVVEYRDGDTVLQGYLAWDDAIQGKRPGVLVVHEWWGLNDYVQTRARLLAGLGYVAFAPDMYGQGKATTHPDQAGEWMSQITANVKDWQRRAQAGLDVLRARDIVDPDRTAAIGYCFGGATVMQMAYAGADLDAVVSFHGALPVADEADLKNIKARVLVAHGSADSFVPGERVAAFQAALDKAGADWQMVSYGGARHGFTNPDAGKLGMQALQYDLKADHRSWALMESFLSETFFNR